MRRRAGDNEWRRILVSLVVGLALAIVPLPTWAAMARPDVAALLVLYWSLALPRTFGIGSAWLTGLALDTLTGTLLGQHAVALALLAFISLRFHLRIRVFPIWQQAMTVFMLLGLYQFVLLWVDGLAGQGDLRPDRWLPVLTGTLLWPVIAQLLGVVRARRQRV